MMEKKPFIIGSRGSRLALVQAHWVRDQLVERYPDLEVSLVEVKTSGDFRKDHPLTDQGRKGLYTREIELELESGAIDCAVHSMKDLPTELPDTCAIAAVPPREDARDVFISDKYEELLQLPKEAKIGTSSLRRLTQLKNFRPDFKIVPVRGNVETRLSKMRSEKMDGIILAAAGLKRLGLESEITEFLSPSLMLPSGGQGALAIEIRSSDEDAKKMFEFMNDPNTAAAVSAERACLRRLSGGCEVPITAYAEVAWNRIEIIGLVAGPDGRELIRDQVEGDLKDPEAVGLKCADALFAQGAQRLIKQILSHVKKR